MLSLSMSLSIVVREAKQRLIDMLGGGAAFSGASGSAVALIAADGRILKLSAPARRMFAEAEKAGALSGLFMPEDRDAVDQAVRSKALCRLEARARRPGGAAGTFEIMLERRPDGRSAALLIDRTAERLAERRIRQDADRARAESVEGAALLADLSHEMRTPLNAVIGFAETIERETFGPVGHENYQQYAEHIRMAGRHLLDLVNTVLDLSRIDAERFSLNRIVADAGAVAREASAMMRGEAEASGLTLIVDIADDVPESFIDPRAVRQILLNLLSNAVKFTAAGEIALTVRREGDMVAYTVKDDGVGMSEQALKAIGARFTTAHGAGVRGQGGAGLGLSLAIRLAQLHGGAVDLASAPGEGLTAVVRLPVKADRETPKGAAGSLIAAARAPHAEASSPDDAVALRQPASATITELDRIKAYRRAKPRVDAA